MSLIRKHGAVLQAWACLDLVCFFRSPTGETVGRMLTLNTSYGSAQGSTFWG